MAADWNPPSHFPRPTKEKRSIGSRKTMEERLNPPAPKKLKPFGDTVRGESNKTMPLVKRVVAGHVAAVTGIPYDALMLLDPDHLHGKNGIVGGMPAAISPLNIQLLPRMVHEAKTNSLQVGGQRYDYRPADVLARMALLTARLVDKAGPHPTPKDWRRAFRSELLGKTKPSKCRHKRRGQFQQRADHGGAWVGSTVQLARNSTARVQHTGR